MWNSGSKCADSAIIKSRNQIAIGYSLTGNRYRPSKLSELPDLPFVRRVEICFSKRPFAGHFNKSVVLKLRYGGLTGLSMRSHWPHPTVVVCSEIGSYLAYLMSFSADELYAATRKHGDFDAQLDMFSKSDDPSVLIGDFDNFLNSFREGSDATMAPSQPNGNASDGVAKVALDDELNFLCT